MVWLSRILRAWRGEPGGRLAGPRHSDPARDTAYQQRSDWEGWGGMTVGAKTSAHPLPSERAQDQPPTEPPPT